MKTKYLIIGIIAITTFVACDDMHDMERPGNSLSDSTIVATNGITGLYILSEGLFNMNNSTLAYYSFENDTLQTDFFESVNKRGLGDTSNDIKKYGNKIYIVVNVSSDVEVINAKTGKSIKQISLFNENHVAREPRYITFSNGFAYVCCFDGYVARIDTTTLKTDKLVRCGRNPDGICTTNDNLYVSNSGGLDNPDYDSTVSVINLKTFTEIKKITVGMNPGKMVVDNENNVYVIVRGNYDKVDYKLVKINAATNEVEQTVNGINPLNMNIYNDTIYMYSYNYSTKENWIKLFDCNNDKIVDENFIKDGTKLTTPYGMAINPVNGDVYITDAFDYTVMGDVLCFDKNGFLKFRLREVGMNPNNIIFIK